MRANHAVTLGLCVGLTGLAVCSGSSGAGPSTFGTCNDDDTCGGGADASTDGEGDGGAGDSSITVDTGSPGTPDGRQQHNAVDSGDAEGQRDGRHERELRGGHGRLQRRVRERADRPEPLRVVQQGVRGAGRGHGHGAVLGRDVQRDVRRQHDAGLQRDVLQPDGSGALRGVLDGVPGAEQRRRRRARAARRRAGLRAIAGSTRATGRATPTVIRRPPTRASSPTRLASSFRPPVATGQAAARCQARA